ncbi:MAG: hypothetical protein FWE22_07865 [Firmicutes bacterium]|nr:hypothetical protein [Bacillota bacterium]
MFLSKPYKDLENRLIEKFEQTDENEVVLEDDDFKDGRLTIFGYEKLKQQCDYIPYSEKIEIKIPKKNEKGFKERLEYLGALELIKIKKDRREVRKTALLLLLVGVVTFVIGSIVELFASVTNRVLADILFYIIIIISWVFVWAAVEKWFFDRRDLREKRKSLLQILSSNITTIEKE